jgi:hypothetical protein
MTRDLVVPPSGSRVYRRQLIIAASLDIRRLEKIRTLNRGCFWAAGPLHGKVLRLAFSIVLTFALRNSALTQRSHGGLDGNGRARKGSSARRKTKEGTCNLRKADRIVSIVSAISCHAIWMQDAFHLIDTLAVRRSLNIMLNLRQWRRQAMRVTRALKTGNLPEVGHRLASEYSAPLRDLSSLFCLVLLPRLAGSPTVIKRA